jgi:hypothetical protein
MYDFLHDMIYLTAIGLQPVAAVQHKFTHKQNTEYRERNIHNNKKIKHTQQ